MTGDPIPALKRQVGDAIARELRGWRAADIANVLRMHATGVSHLRNGNVDRFTLDSLVRIAARTRLDVAITLTRRRSSNGRRSGAS